MKTTKTLLSAIIAALPTFTLCAEHTPRAKQPDAVLDLRTIAGATRVNGQWRYSDTSVHEIDHKSVGPDLKASGPANRTFDFTPDARAADFDDSNWEVIPADSLEKRRGNGRLSFNWYRINVTVPEKVGRFDVRGSTIVFETVVDDYAEVWVNGKAPFVLGQNGGSVAAGWNAPNRVVLTKSAEPGERIQIAVFGILRILASPGPELEWLRRQGAVITGLSKRASRRPPAGVANHPAA